MNRLWNAKQRVVWLTAFAVVLMVTVLLISTGGQKSASADELQKLNLSSVQAGTPPKTELLMYDWTKPVTVREKGMPRHRPPMASANGDWTKPRNFAQGTMHFRIEFIGMPVTKKMQVQFCVWQDDWKREQCAKRSGVFSGTKGTVVTWSAPISTMWKLPGSQPIDWTRPRMIWGYVIRTADGKPVHPKFNWGGQNTAQWFPLYWRATAVVVEKGATFGGWNNYIR